MSRRTLLLSFVLFSLFILFCGRVRIAPPDLAFYYTYPQSIINDADLQFHNEYGQYPFAMHELYRTQEGYPANDWPPGTGYCWLPFLLLAKMLCGVTGIPYEQGNSWFAQWIVTYSATLLFGFGTIFLTWKWCLLEGLPRKAAAWSLSLFSIGSTFTYHLYVNSADSHLPSAFFSVLLFYTWRKLHPHHLYYKYALLGMIAGFAALIRPHNVFFVLIPILHDAPVFIKQKRIKHYLLSLLILSTAFIITISPQFIIWKTLYGSWIASPRAGDLLWSHPQWFNTLFSHYHGMISWSPLVFFGIIGLFLSRKGWLFSIPVLLQLYLVSCHIAWWAGGSFGNRRMLGCVPLFIFGLAYLIHHTPKLWLKIVICLCALWSMLLMLAEIGGTLPLSQPLSWFEIFYAIPKGILPGLQFHFSLPQWQGQTVSRLFGWVVVTFLFLFAWWVLSNIKWTTTRCTSIAAAMVSMMILLTSASAFRSTPLTTIEQSIYKPVDRFNWEVYYESSFFHLRSGDTNRAIQHYLAAIALEPRHPQPARYVSIIWKTLGSDLMAYHYARTAMISGYRSDAFLDYFEQQISLMIRLDLLSQFNLYNERGIVRTIRGNYDGAAIDFKQALRVEPHFIHAQNNLDKLEEWKKGVQVRLEWR